MSEREEAKTDTAPLQRTPLYGAQTAQGAKMVPFAGYSMPLQYEGILSEHRHVREAAGLFDVSHMGQLVFRERRRGAIDALLERLTPADLGKLGDGQARYSVLTTEAGGTLDDVIMTRLGDHVFVVVNGARREAVLAHLAEHADPDVAVEVLERALIALQGPEAESVLREHVPLALDEVGYMRGLEATLFGEEGTLVRCGYTGEDGFELSLPARAAQRAWDALIADPRVRPVGLGARDTLRLEAGLCLYGQDLTEAISPVEAGLDFVIAKRRAREGGFLGARRILAELQEGPERLRVGLTVEGRVPARAGAPLLAHGQEVGVVTSGGVSPSIGSPIAMALIRRDRAKVGTELEATVRGRAVPVRIATLPFLQPRTRRKG